MKLPFATLIALAVCVSAGPSAGAEEAPTLAAAFEAKCIRCHGQRDRVKGEVDLREVKTDADLLARPKLIEKLVEVLEERRMPPEKAPALEDSTREQMLTQLGAVLKTAQETAPYGPTPIRRMNRFQYNNAVVDLLELDREIFALNERLMRRRDDYFKPATRKMPNRVRVSSRPLSKDIDNQRPEGFRGVASFPQDKRAEHGFDNRADHLTLSPLLMESFLRLSQTIVESPDLNPRECRSWDWLFAEPGKSVRGPVKSRYEGEAQTVRAQGKGPAKPQQLGQHWSGNAHLFWQCRRPDREITISFDVPQKATGLRFRLTKAVDYGTFSILLDDEKIGDDIDLFNPSPIAVDHRVEKLDIAPGRHTLRFRCTGKKKESKRHFFGLDFFELIGAEGVETPVVATNEVAVIRDRLGKLLRRAFRRPVDEKTLDRFTVYAKRKLEAGASFEDTMRTAVGAVLGMPDFLYFYEEADDDAADSGRQPINDFELASRLSQFFWSSIPDDELLDAAEAGRLSEPEVLSAQIDRMLNDARTGRFCDNFPSQWLQLDRLITSIPDPKKFRYFYYSGYRTSMHMMSEPLLLFETVFVEDRSIIELLDPKFSWRSAMLKANYAGNSKGHHQVQVQTFDRVQLTDPREGGVITNLAVLTMTSTPTRTQPITRGAWVNAVIFNDPPEPPPADVPPLNETDHEKIAKMTIRERLADHRKRVDCAGCHNKIDPLGFALENYGPTGVWRDKYENGRDVDSAGVLFNKHKFDTVVEFKALLLKEKQRFIRGFVAHLLSYALGRELGVADAPALDAMTAKAMTGEDQMRAVLKSVAMSEPFLHKNVQRKSVSTPGK